tara:strand:- start:257 stop:466 length:210 start_codon:yes stop_codon:yes gene_type:complete
MKVYNIRAERQQVGYYSIKCKSLEEAKRQALYQMAVNPKTVIEFEKCTEIILPEEAQVIEPHNQFIKEE